MKSKQSTYQSSPSSKRSQPVQKPVKKLIVSSTDYGMKSAALDNALVKAETTQLESYIKSRSQFLDVEIDKLRNKLHAPLTKGSGTEVAGTSNALYLETESAHNSGSHGYDRSRTHDDTSMNTSVNNHLSPNTAEISAIGQGMALSSKGRGLENELGYNGISDRNRGKNGADNRSKNSDVNKRGVTGESNSRKMGREVDVDSSDDSDLSDGQSRARTHDRITGVERRTDSEDKLSVPMERNRAEHSVDSQKGRIDDEDDVDPSAAAGTALVNLFDRITRGKYDWQYLC